MTINERANELANNIKNSQEWNYEFLDEFCKLAGLEKEWCEADDDTFESVVYKASEILGVEID